MSKISLTFFLMVGLCLILAVPAWADVQAGLDAYVRGDYETVLKEWRPLAEQGDTGAQFNLALLYANGQGVPQDYRVHHPQKEAMRWYRLAAEQGDVGAQFNLALLYANGQGVPQDDIEAAKWYRRAAEQGFAKAQSNLGEMYSSGKGVPQDYVLAHMWANLAASQGEDVAVKKRDALAKSMTPAQLAEAQRLAREWKPKGK